ncbi:MAG: hypothetical protein ACK5Y2_08320 [Bdellovibrionales bacterium]
MKSNFQLILSAMMIAQSATVYGQAPVGSVNPIVGGSSNGPTIIGSQAGDYNINQVTQDNTKVMLAILQRTDKIQDVDRQYLLGIAERMNTKLNELNDLRIKLVTMSRALEMQPLDKYLQLITEVDQKNQALILDLSTSTVINRESLPSYSPIQVGGTTATVNNYGEIRFDELTKRVDTIRTTLISSMNDLKFLNLVSPVGQPVQITSNALNPNLQGIRILTRQQIEQYREKIEMSLTLNEDTVLLQQRYVDQVVNLINQFVTNYGTSEWLRFTDDNDAKARRESFERITDAFQRRSFLRKKYGIRMGAIQPKGEYPKRIANFEKFALQPLREALGVLNRAAAMNDIELQAAFENTRNFVQMYDEKVTPVLKSRSVILSHDDKKMDFSSSDTGFLVRVNSTVTFLTGQRPTAEILLSIMRLILSDIQEEMMLSMNKVEAMKNYHDAKYRATDALKAANNKRICEIDFTLSANAHQRNCVPLGITRKAAQLVGGSGQGVAETFSALLNIYEYDLKADRQDAENARKILEAALAAGNDQAKEDEENDLFN